MDSFYQLVTLDPGDSPRTLVNVANPSLNHSQIVAHKRSFSSKSLKIYPNLLLGEISCTQTNPILSIRRSKLNQGATLRASQEPIANRLERENLLAGLVPKAYPDPKGQDDKSSPIEAYHHYQIEKNLTTYELSKSELTYLHYAIEDAQEKEVMKLITQIIPHEDLQDKKKFTKINSKVGEIFLVIKNWREKGLENMFVLYNRILSEQNEHQNRQDMVDKLKHNLEYCEKLVDEKDNELYELKSKLNGIEDKYAGIVKHIEEEHQREVDKIKTEADEEQRALHYKIQELTSQLQMAESALADISYRESPQIDTLERGDPDRPVENLPQESLNSEVPNEYIENEDREYDEHLDTGNSQRSD